MVLKELKNYSVIPNYKDKRINQAWLKPSLSKKTRRPLFSLCNTLDLEKGEDQPWAKIFHQQFWFPGHEQW